MPEIQELDETTADIAFDAMCIWEWALEARERKFGNGILNNFFDKYGTCEMRVQCVSVLPYARSLWQHAVDLGYEDCFDWEYVPWFMENCVDFLSNPWRYDMSKLPPGCVGSEELLDLEASVSQNPPADECQS